MFSQFKTVLFEVTLWESFQVAVFKCILDVLEYKEANKEIVVARWRVEPDVPKKLWGNYPAELNKLRNLVRIRSRRRKMAI